MTDSAITTPHRLPWFNAARSVRILLTPTERRKPWILYLTPGLLAAEVFHIVYVVIGLRTFRILLLPELSDPETAMPSNISVTKLVVYFAVVVLSTIVLCPLEVIATRLAVQRNHASAEYNSVAQEIDGDAEEAAEYAGAEEDVIGYVASRSSFVIRNTRFTGFQQTQERNGPIFGHG